MSTDVIVALIGAIAVIIAAIIGIIGKRKKESDCEAKTIITQKAEGNNTTQIGIQINSNGSDKK